MTKSPGPTPLPTRVRRRDRQRQETRERIFEAALAEFREAGFAGSQVDRIVQRAGVARGTFYFHFPSKEHVLLELQRRAESEVTRRIAAAEQQAENLRDCLRGVVDAIYTTDTGLDGELQRELLAMYVRQPTPLYVEPVTDPLLSDMADAFAEAAERGEISPELSPEELVSVFMRALFGWVAIQGAEGDEAPDSVDLFIDIFVKGVAP
jgi:AcrR family transcriptional regulator